MAFSRLSVAASSAFRRVSRSPGRQSKQVPDNDNSPATTAETVDTRGGERSNARWSTAQLADIGIGRTSQQSASSNSKSLRLEIPFDSETSLGRQAIRRTSNDSVSSNLSGEVESYDSDLNLGSAPEVKVIAPGQDSATDISFSKDDTASNEENRYNPDLDIRSSRIVSSDFVGSTVRPSAEKVAVATQTDFVDELIEEKRKRSILEEHKSEIEQMVVELTKQNKELAARNKTLEEELSRLQGITELQKQTSVSKEDGFENDWRKAEEGGRFAAEGLVEDLKHRNEALTVQLTRAENVETQTSAVSFERKELSEEIVALKHEVKTYKDKAHTYNEEESLRWKSEESLVERTRSLKLEYETMQEKLLNSAEGEKKARRQSEAASLKCQQLQSQCDELDTKLLNFAEGEKKARRQSEAASLKCHQLQSQCDELDDKLAVAVRAEREETQVAEQSQNGFNELQGERSRLRERLASAEAECTRNDSFEMLSLRSNLIESECKRFQAECEEMRREREMQPAKRNEVTKLVDDMEAKQKDELRSNALKVGGESPVQHISANNGVARSEEITKRGDTIDTKKMHEEGTHLPVTTSLLNSLALQPEVPDIVVLQRECRQLQQQMAAAFHDESELYDLVELLRDQLAEARNQEKASKMLAEHRLHHCEELENECGELQVELLQGKSVITPWLQGAKPALAWNSYGAWQVEYQFKNQTRPAELAAKQAAKAAVTNEFLELECERLKSELKTQTSEAELAAKQAADDHESLRREHEKLKRESLDRVRSSAAVQLMLEDAASADALYRRDEQSMERAKSTAAVQPLLEDAALVDASRYCEDLKRECDWLRSRSTENAMVAVANELLLEDAVAGELDLELSLRSKQHLQQGYSKLEKELSVALQTNIDISNEEQTLQASATRLENELRNAQSQVIRYEKAEKDAEMAVEAGSRSYHELQRTYDALQTRDCIQTEISNEDAKVRNQEIQNLREQVARAEEAERLARRSAEAAADLMRRKENLRQCQQLREQVARAVETQKDARQSADVAMELQRLICDLGSTDSDTASMNQLSIIATPPHQPLSPLT